HYFVNCLPDSFRTAAETLANRIGRYGTSPEVAEWVKGQDAVFANCSENTELPNAITDGPQWLRHDRAYQIAAAKFYRTEFESARAGLDAIAADKSNPWSKTARYVAARTFIRQASLIPASEDPALADAEEARRKAFLQQADERLRSVIDDPEMSAMHSSAVGLLGLVRFRM